MIRPLTEKILILQPTIYILRDNVDHLNKKTHKTNNKNNCWHLSLFEKLFFLFLLFYSQFVYTKKSFLHFN